MSQEQINKLQATALINLSGFYHFGLVYSWFCERALTLPSCLVSCWSVVFGSRHSCLVSGPVLVSCRGSNTHAPGLVLLVEACGLEFARAVRSSVRVHSLSSFCFLLFCLVLCDKQLVFFTGCMRSCLSCFV